MLVTVKKGTHIAWKILPGSTVEESAEKCFRAQSSADWSAIYAQLSVEHAVSYLNNHYDRGHECAHLVSITAARDLQCAIYTDGRMAANDLGPLEKAVLLRNYLNNNVCSAPLKADESLMKSVGDQLGIFVVLPDSESLLECVIPHSLMDSDRFEFCSHALFERDIHNPCRTRQVILAGEPIALSKDERSDPALLGRRLAGTGFGPLSPVCQWAARWISRGAAAAEEKAHIDDVLPMLSDILMTPVARVRDSEKSSDDAVIRRVTISEAAEIAARNSLSVKTLPRRPEDYDAFHKSKLPSNHTFVASDGNEYHVAPLCLPPPAEIAKFLRDMKVKREQGYFRMTPPSKIPVPTPGRPRYPELPKEWMRSSKLSPSRKGKMQKQSLSAFKEVSTDWSADNENEPPVIDKEDLFDETPPKSADSVIAPFTPASLSLWARLRDEIIGDSSEGLDEGIGLDSQEDADTNSTINIENFIGVPRRLEGFVWFGVAVCLEAFLHAISIMMIRFVVSLYFVIRNSLSKTKKIYQTHLFDMCRGGLIIVGCSVLMMFHMSRVYHIIRTQSTIKLYSFTSMLEVFDRLLGSFGQDAMQYLHAAIKKDLNAHDYSKSQFWNVSFAFLVASVYVAIHSSLYFITIATLTVAVNTADKALMTVLIINNFAEIKAFAFKKFDKEALFVMSCGDITERFQIVLFFGLISALGVLHSESSLMIENLWMNLQVLACMVGAEMLADWIKHAFIAKFNKIGPGIYRKYARILRADYVTYRKERVILDYTHFIARRVALAQVISVNNLWTMKFLEFCFNRFL